MEGGLQSDRVVGIDDLDGHGNNRPAFDGEQFGRFVQLGGGGYGPGGYFALHGVLELRLDAPQHAEGSILESGKRLQKKFTAAGFGQGQLNTSMYGAKMIEMASGSIQFKQRGAWPLGLFEIDKLIEGNVGDIHGFGWVAV